MPDWLHFFLNSIWLPFALNALRVIAAIKSLFRKKEIDTHKPESPFVTVPIKDLANKISSPLKVVPKRIGRTFQVKPEPGVYLLLGGAGVGKTREAIDLAKHVATLSGANTVFLANGYVDASAPLPSRSDVRRVVIVIDDYDYGFGPAGALSFEERQVGYAHAIGNLKRFHRKIMGSIDLHALIVTVNTHRLPISVFDVTESFPDCSVTSIQAVTPEEFRKFIAAASDELGLQISAEAMDILVQGCDGRFDTVATFLADFIRNSSVQKSDAEKYTTVRQAAWTLFKSKLSNEQQAVYEQVRILKSFRLPARLEYITALLRRGKHKRSLIETQQIVESVWPVMNGKAIIYDGQIGPLKGSEPDPTIVATAILDSCGLRIKNRYAFQEEAKTFGLVWIQRQSQKEQIAFFKRMAKWYPRDRYFAFQLAESRTGQGQHYRAILTLYRILNRWDVRVVYSGKWVEIQCHLLLAQLYQKIWAKKIRNWELQGKVEREFKIAIGLIEIGSDLGPNDFETVYSTIPSRDVDKMSEIDHNELGFQRPSEIPIDLKRLHGMVHHRYAIYLINQHHREYDTLKHEEIASQMIPKFGDAALYCAVACNQIGDNERALKFIEQARLAGPAIFDSTEFKFLLLYTGGNALRGLGDVNGAKTNLQQCLEIARKHPEDADRVLKLEGDLRDEGHWRSVMILPTLRRKAFAPNLKYEISDPNFVFVFPPQWKIDQEGADERGGRMRIQATFSSHVSWREGSKGPIDASVNVFCSNLPEQMSLDAQSLGLRYVENFPKIFQATVECRVDETLTNADKRMLWSVRFIAKQMWPKQGIVIVAALPAHRVQLMLLYEEMGADELRQPIEKLARDFIDQALKKFG
jgi:tetratricopeptide (TPR) repeat protein